VSSPGFVTERWIGNYVVRLKRDGKFVPDVFKLDRAVTLEGRVLGTDGKPLANVPLAFDFFHDRMASINNRRFTSDAKGEFKLEGLPAGELFVRYSRSPTGEDPVPQPVKFFAAHVKAADGQTIRDVTVDLSKATCVLEGQVLDAKGQGIADAYIRVAFVPGAARLDHTVAVRTDAQGRFRLDGLPPDTVSVFASKGAGLGEGVTVDLRPDRPATVRITGYTAGKAPPADRKVEPKWGPTHNGLQAAIVIEPDKSAYAPGDLIHVRMLVRNVSDKPLEFKDTLSYNALHVTRPGGEKERFDFLRFTGLPWTEAYRLDPGHELLLKGSFHLALAAKTDSGRKAMFDLSVEPGQTYRLVVSFGDGWPDSTKAEERWLSGEASLKIGQ
jgi:hypothetical protein